AHEGVLQDRQRVGLTGSVVEQTVHERSRYLGTDLTNRSYNRLRHLVAVHLRHKVDAFVDGFRKGRVTGALSQVLSSHRDDRVDARPRARPGAQHRLQEQADVAVAACTGGVLEQLFELVYQNGDPAGIGVQGPRGISK